MLTKRLCVDNVVNEHDRSLLEFLHDNSLCALNGRFGLNKYTSISTRGSAVVDYAIVR